MKRIGNLKRIWCNYETLLKAFNEVKEGKRYHDCVIAYEKNLAINLNNLLVSLENETYTPKPAREFTIYEPKERVIQAPYFEDRIVQHALLIATREIIESRFLSNSYACRKGFGAHKAHADLRRALIGYNNEGYYLKLDVKKYFYSIQHEVITALLERIIKCKPTIKLFRKFYAVNSTRGLPLGNVTSQVLANLMLNPIDHFIKRELKVKKYFRYMDDLVMLDACKEKLKSIWQSVKSKIESLGLELNSKSKIAQIKTGIDFVGYRTWFKWVVIRKRSLHAIKRKLKKNSDKQRISSLLAHAKRTNSIAYVVKKMIEAAPQEINFIKKWIMNNRGEKFNAIFQS